MTSNATAAADALNFVEAQKSEAATLRAFIAIVALVLVVNVVAGFLFGLGGIGAVAITEAALMLVLCVVLTRG
ncbi:hypothetical protein [Rhodoblastus sp.]|uniref:hypothetical protein n=1 Tax=Rhodoblastus sp. TaxID=1962975 RepID=UPI003F96ECAF